MQGNIVPVSSESFHKCQYIHQNNIPITYIIIYLQPKEDTYLLFVFKLDLNSSFTIINA